jgi:holliday junction DNA helicase RuvA
VIGSINGNILSISASSVLIETASGIGYELEIPLSDSKNLVSMKGNQIRLFTHLSIREDAQVLYGFLHPESRQCFRMLIRVSGIGPKTALAVLSCLSVKEFLYSIINEDIRVLCLVPGIGKKVAERMLLELKDKVDINDFFLSENNEAQVNRISDSYGVTNNDLLPSDLTTTGLYGVRNDIITALLGLGYAEKDARKVVNSLSADVTDVSIGVKQALKIITKMSL